jgi:1,4-alpha-glucan branching enzyme
VANFARHHHENYKVGMPATGEWKVRFNSDSKQYDTSFEDFGSSRIQAEAESQDDQPASAGVSVAPYSVLILSQE